MKNILSILKTSLLFVFGIPLLVGVVVFSVLCLFLMTVTSTTLVLILTPTIQLLEKMVPKAQSMMNLLGFSMRRPTEAMVYSHIRTHMKSTNVGQKSLNAKKRVSTWYSPRLLILRKRRIARMKNSRTRSSTSMKRG